VETTYTSNLEQPPAEKGKRSSRCYSSALYRAQGTAEGPSAPGSGVPQVPTFLFRLQNLLQHEEGSRLSGRLIQLLVLLEHLVDLRFPVYDDAARGLVMLI